MARSLSRSSVGCVGGGGVGSSGMGLYSSRSCNASWRICSNVLFLPSRTF
jgi:hypothetical protein